MKRIIALLTIITYFTASSTLAHSFCAKAHMEETNTEHSCCDDEEVGAKDCFDKCMSSFKDATSNAIELSKSTTCYIDLHLETRLFEGNILTKTQNNFLTEFVYDPPWQWNYI